MTALATYKIFSAAGDGCFSAATHSYILSKKDRKLASPLIALGTISKLISLVPFYSYHNIKNEQPHPISGITLPGLSGLISGNIAALAGSGPIANSIGKWASFISGSILSFLDLSVVYEKPSTLQCANAICFPPKLIDQFYCDFDSNTNKTQQVIYIPQNEFPPNCNASRCLKNNYDKDLRSYYETGGRSYTTGLSMVMPVLNPVVAYLNLDRYKYNPLMKDSPDSSLSLYLRTMRLVKQILFLSPIVTHLSLLKANEVYRHEYLPHAAVPLQNAPYLTSTIVHLALGEQHFPWFTDDDIPYRPPSFFLLFFSFASMVLSQGLCNHPPQNLPEQYQVKPVN